ncbi:iron response transcriptional regulator IrrA [Pseudochrobactrum asaccharolyticum]|uniref:iron response transcriptional regulator IrrA n=1 Tax=Pseudochrobactrum asaccharolyticum TaxID=354351 RepID=UPI0040422680
MLEVPENLRAQLRSQRLMQMQDTSRIRSILQKAGLRPTKQRLILGQFLLSGHHQHISADDLHLLVMHNGFSMSLATVYNTLNQFAEAGLIRKISVSGQRTFFDTNARNHQHFYFEDEDRMIDIGGAQLALTPAPQAPEGYTITKIDILVSLKKVENKQL